ncbi:MAG: nitrate reductase cytochrome c-type subunit [Chromatiaceae bacterium]|jgi:nitrate reductase (cytochrome), electron transfer subunit
MKTKTLVTLTASIAAMALSGSPMAAAVESLRGESALSSESPPPEKHQVQAVEGGVPRSYREQPPMIPHDIEKYEISLRENGCLKCHSEATYKVERARRIPDSHYLDRDGKKLSKISMRRYFCTQCHAPQVSGAPLVENVFQGRK